MRVVVVGAGYAGVIAANRLAKKVERAAITVINPRSDFVERVRLHQHLAGTGAAASPLSSMLRAGITVRIGTATKIGDGRVTLDNGEDVAFDYLFLAVGSGVNPMPGTIPVGSWEGAQQARSALAQLHPGNSVTVIGGGPTGIETAAEVAGAYPDLKVRLIGATIAAGLSEGARRRVRKGLVRLGVEIVEDTVVDVEPGGTSTGAAVGLRSGAEVVSGLTLWAIVSGIPQLAGRSGLAVNDEGRAIVDEYLRSVSDDRIFVVGDCAAVPGARLCCAAATPQGAHAADTLARMVSGRTIAPHSMGYVGQALSLGRKDGVIQFSRRDDTVRRQYISGRVGAMAKETVNRYAEYGPRTTRYGWLRGPK